ncbi:glycoside hydrolase family 3 protein [Thalassotalea aquiviva]|uniref:glycoside hydrolase family 3 protein n=1 Tax=Thalassotalea aquiviva TaxID=3242415 RepID=UPI003529E432
MLKLTVKNSIKNDHQSELNKQIEQCLSAMTLDQKIGQMMQVEWSSTSPEDVRKYHIGGVLSAAGSYPNINTPQQWLHISDTFWLSSSVKSSQSPRRTDIPVLFGVDAVHGHANVEGGTIFPHNIGLGCTRDPDLVKRIGQATAKEVLASGINWVFGPNLAVAQDFHWGRVYESFSENTDLVSELGRALISGIQHPFEHESVASCIKHFVGDGGTLYGIDQGDTKLSFEQLQATHIKPFEQGIAEGALTVMASFSSWNGAKCHGSRFLLTDILKDKLQFQGFVVSDMEGIEYLPEGTYSAVAIAVNAGIDMFMAPNNWKHLIEHLRNHVALGTISMSRINDAVRRILWVKHRLGLFALAKPSERKMANTRHFGSEKHRALAIEAVQKSAVLLKNNANVLPLNRQQKIFVAGKNADNIGSQCGGFTLDWQGCEGNEAFAHGCSIWQAIKQSAPNASLSQQPFGEDADPKQHDIAVVVVGELPYAEGLGDIRRNNNYLVKSGSMIDGRFNILEPYGDSLRLSNLHPEDIRTIENIRAKGIKVVTILLSGRPLLINQELDASQAFIAAWLPGIMGNGVVDLLFNRVNFSAKLGFTWPASIDQKAHTKPTSKVLFNYGYGLQYHN